MNERENIVVSDSDTVSTPSTFIKNQTENYKENQNIETTENSSKISSSPVKILINDKSENEDKKEINDNKNIDNNSEESSSDQKNSQIPDSSDTCDKDSKNSAFKEDNQRTSVIVQPESLQEPNKSQNNENSFSEYQKSNTEDKNIKPKFFCESKFSDKVINDLVNSSKFESTIKFRPSVLKLSKNSPTDENLSDLQTENDNKNVVSTSEAEKEINDVTAKRISNLFKFTPLSDRKNATTSIGFNLNNIKPASTFPTPFLNTKNAFSSDNRNNKNYFTENLFKAAQSTSDKKEELKVIEDDKSEGFVFGQNLQERVTNICTKPEKTKSETEIKASDSQSDSNTSNQEKRKYENITGEEDEVNVMNLYCKLFQWDSTTSVWKERGKGRLRLNDKVDYGKTTSRIVMRTAGSLKLILNCLIISGMKIEITNDCLRFSNLDGIYLIKGKAQEIDQLHNKLQSRLKMLPKKTKPDDTSNIDKTSIDKNEPKIVNEDLDESKKINELENVKLEEKENASLIVEKE